jgi:4,5-DOPA dioxygenase extradiol
MTTQSDTPKKSATGRMPVIFAAHGAPILLDDAAWIAELASWAKAMPSPKSILMVSAHWEERPTTLGATRPVPLVYDFLRVSREVLPDKVCITGRPRACGQGA